jgi:hypothetical protein
MLDLDRQQRRVRRGADGDSFRQQRATGIRTVSFTGVSIAAGQAFWFTLGFQGLNTGGTNPAYNAVASATTAVPETGPVASGAVFGFFEATGITGALTTNPTVSIVRNTSNQCPHMWAKVS